MFNEAIQALIDNIRSMVVQMLRNADYDRTYTGRVKSVEQVRKGLSTYLYTITINGRDYTIKSKLLYNVDDYVLVLFPRNNWNDAKIVATGDDVISGISTGDTIISLEQRMVTLESQHNDDSEQIATLVEAVQLLLKLTSKEN